MLVRKSMMDEGKPYVSRLSRMTVVTAELLNAQERVTRLESPFSFWHYTRCFEYPWVHEKLGEKNGKVLDVGTNLMFWVFLHSIGYDIAVHHTSHDIASIGATATGVGWLTAAPYLKDKKFQVYVGEPDELDLKDEVFDTITNISVMEHLPNWKFEKWLYGLWRMLKRGGRMIVTCDWPYEFGFGDGLKNYVNHDWRPFIAKTGAILSEADEVPWASDITAEKIDSDQDVVTVGISDDHPQKPDSKIAKLAVYGFILTKP